MKLLQVVAEGIADAWIRARQIDLTFANAEIYARKVIEQAKPSGWLVEFPNGTVFIDSEVLMRANLANGYKCTPLYAGEQL